MSTRCRRRPTRPAAERGAADLKLQATNASSPVEAAKIFDPKTEKWTVFRLPYPMPSYTRGVDGRIDDARTGWKGRGLWASYSSYLPKFSETRLGSVNYIQIRPNPLAN